MKIEHQIKFLNELAISLPTLELTLPHLTFKDRVTFYGTQRSAELFTLGGGHSHCDAVLYIPKEKIIFMGDLLFVDCHPAFFEESNPNKWLDMLQQIKAMDINIAVPGHGPIGTSIHLLQIIEYIQHLTLIAQENLALENIQIPANYQHWSSSEIYLQNIKQVRELLC